jgi:hypothetical protein
MQLKYASSPLQFGRLCAGRRLFGAHDGLLDRTGELMRLVADHPKTGSVCRLGGSAMQGCSEGAEVIICQPGAMPDRGPNRFKLGTSGRLQNHLVDSCSRVMAGEDYKLSLVVWNGKVWSAIAANTGKCPAATPYTR